VNKDLDDELAFDPALAGELGRVLQPLKRLLSPVAIGLEHIPREGAVLLAGNHTIYGMLDVPMLGMEVYEATGRPPRGLGDHFHFTVPVWRDLLRRFGAVRGTREICGRLFEAGEVVLVFPGGSREVFKQKGEKYRLQWKERVGFARLAIQHGAPIVPFASVGVEDAFEIVLDVDDILRSPVGHLIRSLGLMEKSWFRRGEIVPPLARGTGRAGLPRLERLYFLFGPPIDTRRYAGRHEDREACSTLRREVQGAVETLIEHLRAVQEADPERYTVPRLLRRLAARLG
jgi:1-acyl-sn-glycerol-3-phosphate acyltransferase